MLGGVEVMDSGMGCFGRFQAYLIYMPCVRMPGVDVRNLRRYHLAGWARNVEIETKDGETLLAWHVLPGGGAALEQALADGSSGFDAVLRQPGARVVLYFHGLAFTRGYKNRVERVKAISAHLLAHTIVVDYRGFGGSTGFPSEEGIAEDARATLRWLRQRVDASAKIYIFGQSLGSGIAVRLAAEMSGWHMEGRPELKLGDIVPSPPTGLILESGYRDVPSATDTHPLSAPIRIIPAFKRRLQSKIDQWNSLDQIRHVQGPILIMHGQKDRKIPYDQAESLRDAAIAARRERRKQSGQVVDEDYDENVFISPFPESGHSNIQSDAIYYREMLVFIRKVEDPSTL